MNFSEEASNLELVWLESGKLEDVDDKFIQDNLDKHKTGEPIPVEPQYSGNNYYNSGFYTEYQYGKPEFEFEASFFLDNLNKLEQLMNFLQQKDIVVKSYHTNWGFYTAISPVTVTMNFSVPGYKMNGTSYNQLFEDIKKHIGVYGQIQNINCKMHTPVISYYRM